MKFLLICDIYFRQISPPRIDVSKDALNHFLDHSSAQNKQSQKWYFSYSAFWSTGQWGRGAIAPHGYSTEKHNDSHSTALSELLCNSGKIILPRLFEVFIVQCVITVGAMKTYASFITLKYIDK